MTEIQEGVEVPEPEHFEGLHEYRYTLPVSLTLSILAVLVAGATLLGHRAHTEELLMQSRASDQWAYYQAKNIRLHEMQGLVDVLSALAPQETKETAAVREKYINEVQRYENDKDDIGERAREFEKERDLATRRADRFDGGEALLEVGLVICSITLWTRRRAFWIGGVLVGLLGVLMALTGFFLK
jgi:hypothetical protein